MVPRVLHLFGAGAASRHSGRIADQFAATAGRLARYQRRRDPERKFSEAYTMLARARRSGKPPLHTSGT